jgi:hypothetical protein
MARSAMKSGRGHAAEARLIMFQQRQQAALGRLVCFAAPTIAR